MHRRQLLSLLSMVAAGTWLSPLRADDSGEADMNAGDGNNSVTTSISLDAFQPPMDVTLMGVVIGAARHYESEAGHMDVSLPVLSDAMLFGVTGQAFLINVNETVEQSSPYIWNRDPFFRLVRNTGLEFQDLGFFSGRESVEQRQAAQDTLRDALSSGKICSLINMEHQLVTGFDESGLVTSPPWPWNKAYPPRRLSFDSWVEFGSEFHCNFFVIDRVARASEETMIRSGFEYALSVLQQPEVHQESGFVVGLAAYDLWIDVVTDYGDTHGHWWNAAVWGQCRDFAQKYCVEVAERLPEASVEAYSLAKQYDEIASGFRFVGDVTRTISERRARLRQMRDIEAATERTLLTLLAKLPLPTGDDQRQDQTGATEPGADTPV
ncbi:MAG: hypothetical protein AAF525_04935 [Pseudomonadota bacterium]